MSIKTPENHKTQETFKCNILLNVFAEKNILLD